jgi:hypothetical protein
MVTFKILFLWIIFVMKTNLLHYLPLIYFVTQPVHVSGVFIAHHQEVFTVYVQQLVRVIGSGDRLLEFHPDPASSQSPKRITRTNCCIYTVNTS